MPSYFSHLGVAVSAREGYHLHSEAAGHLFHHQVYGERLHSLSGKEFLYTISTFFYFIAFFQKK
jgi:hypothetical protein